MASPLFIRTPILSMVRPSGFTQTPLFTATAPTLIEKVSYNGGTSVPVETDAGRIRFLVNDNDGNQGMYLDVAVPANDPATDTLDVQGSVVLDLVLPIGWSLDVIVDLAVTGGAPNSQDLDFTTVGGELQ